MQELNLDEKLEEMRQVGHSTFIGSILNYQAFIIGFSGVSFSCVLTEKYSISFLSSSGLVFLIHLL